MKKLKLKIFASFMLLVLLLAVAGVLSIVEFRRLSRSVGGLIDDNFISIEAAKEMLDALERQDSGILLLILGENQEAVAIIQAGEKAFLASLDVARNNLTEPNEEAYLERIIDSYQEFHSQVKASFEDQPIDMAFYQNEIHVAFLNTKQSINALMSLNQQSMYQQAARLGEESRRAIMLGIVAIASALVFSVLLNFFISRYFVEPITSIAQAIDNVQKGDVELGISIRSRDELKTLERAVNSLLLRLKN